MVFETESVGRPVAAQGVDEPLRAPTNVLPSGKPGQRGADRDQVLLQLQQTHGNAYVQRMLRAESEGARAGTEGTTTGPTEAEVIAKWNELCADKMFDDDDWKVIAPMLSEFTGRISAVSELMLSTANMDFDNPNRTFVTCRTELVGFLRKCGYRMPDSGLNPGNIKEVRGSNRFLPAPSRADFANSVVAVRIAGVLSADDFIAELMLLTLHTSLMISSPICCLRCGGCRIPQTS